LLLPVTPWSRDCGIKADQPSTIRNRLFNHFLELSSEHSSAVAIKRDMEPVAFLAFDNEFVGLSNVSGARRISPGLGDGGSAINYLSRRRSPRRPYVDQLYFNLLVNYLDLLVDHSAGEAVDRHVHPVTLFPYNYKAVLKTCSVRRVAATLRDYVDEQVPSTRLIDFAKRARDGFTLSFWHRWP